MNTYKTYATNRYMSNFDEIKEHIKEQINNKWLYEEIPVQKSQDKSQKTSAKAEKVKKIDDTVVTGSRPPYEELSQEDVKRVKQLSNTKSEWEKLEKWINEEIFENGKYDKMDSKSVVLLAKFMFNEGLKYV